MDAISKIFGGGGGGDSDLIKGFTEMVSKGGGMQGLVSKFDAAGLGDKARSWVGGGSNEPITGQEMRQALGDEEVDQLAQKAGISPDEASDKLAKIVPEAVNKLTPDGQMPDPSKLQEMMKSLPGM
jgi:uncharacterized protein YidB (DUF937 family)